MYLDCYQIISLKQKEDLKEIAAEWFHSKWNVPKKAYLECMSQYLNKETEYGWYLCLLIIKLLAE